MPHSAAVLRNVLILFTLLAASAASSAPKPSLSVGVDANYSLDMERSGKTWTWDGASPELFAGMAQHGVHGIRVRLWTKEDGAHGRTYATEVVKRALAGGLDPYLVIFLSEDWADMMKQPVPKAWKDLSFEARRDAVRDYSRDAVAHFRKEGLRSHLYEIGNEIDYGICGEYPGKGTKKNPETLGRRLWPRSAELIRASQAGVRAADPDAQFLLHIAHWWDAGFCVAFFRFMLDHDVQVDYAGLSYFPSANIGGSLEMEEFGATATRLAAAIQRPIIVPETAYPSTRDFSGQFSRWKYEAPGYPLTPDGQRRWIVDFLAFCQRHPDIRAVYYWSPEWCGEGMWKGFALFDPAGRAKPAWPSFAAPAWQNRARLEPVYLEAVSNQLFRVPVEEARSRMVEKVLELRKQTGGVTVEHIALLSNTAVRVGAYAVNLRASLQQNLSVSRVPDVAGVSVAGEAPDLARLLAGAQPSTHRLVVMLRAEPTPELQRAFARFEKDGYEVILHPVPDGLPLRFGMCGTFTGSSD